MCWWRNRALRKLRSPRKEANVRRTACPTPSHPPPRHRRDCRRPLARGPLGRAARHVPTPWGLRRGNTPPASARRVANGPPSTPRPGQPLLQLLLLLWRHNPFARAARHVPTPWSLRRGKTPPAAARRAANGPPSTSHLGQPLLQLLLQRRSQRGRPAHTSRRR